MKTLTVPALVALLLFPVAASAQFDVPRLYFLRAGSSYQTGCFGPCDCPVLEQPMQGTFHLRQSSVDPLFTNYDVLDVRWTMPNATQNLTIVGSGTYRVGGEFAVQHQMVLDVSVGSGPVRRFDSGLIPGGGTFPVIDIKVPLHGDQACTDTVLHVVASPGTATSVEASEGSVVPGVRAVTSTPFRDHVGLALGVPRSSRVDVSIFDTQGRLVRRLASGWWAPGERSIGWDGKTDGGADAGAGLYFVRALIGGERFFEKVVRVK